MESLLSYRFPKESLFRGDQVAKVRQLVRGCVQFVGAVCAHLREGRWAPEARAFEQEGQDLVDDVAAFSPADVRGDDTFAPPAAEEVDGAQ